LTTGAAGAAALELMATRLAATNMALRQCQNVRNEE